MTYGLIWPMHTRGKAEVLGNGNNGFKRHMWRNKEQTEFRKLLLKFTSKSPAYSN